MIKESFCGDCLRSEGRKRLKIYYKFLLETSVSLDIQYMLRISKEKCDFFKVLKHSTCYLIIWADLDHMHQNDTTVLSVDLVFHKKIAFFVKLISHFPVLSFFEFSFNLI